MKLQKALSDSSHPRPVIEPLEPRIAPALLVTGANLLGGAGNPNTGQGSIGGNSITLVTVLSGEAIVWYDHGFIDAISFGPNTSLNIVGDVGALIGNLNANGTLTNSTGSVTNGLDGDVLLPNNLIGLTTHPLSNELGSVGNIITGGSVSNVNVAGNLSGIFAGDGAFKTPSHLLSNSSVSVALGSSMDINPILPGNQSVFTFTAGNDHALSGASVSNIKIGAADALQIMAGDGAPGAPASAHHAATPGQPGGSISNIAIGSAFIPSGASSNTPAYYFLAGSGGSGVKGGAGGSISNINESASNGLVDILGGAGGNGTSGAGGVGGSIKNLSMNSDSSAYTLHAGAGGSGAPGGAGGSVKSVNFGGNQLSNGIVLAADFTGSGTDSILLVDGQSGTMVIEQKGSNGWTPVAQDSINNLYTVASQGSTPIGAVAVNLTNQSYNGNPLLDIVVAYKNSDNLGVFMNQGGGVFYTRTMSGGDTLDGTTVALPVGFAPTAVAAGIFTGNPADQDIAVALSNQGTAELLTLEGNGQGQFTLLTPVSLTVSASVVNLVPAIIQGTAYSDLFAAYSTGQIDALLSTGSDTSAPFNDIPTGITVPGLTNIDWDQLNPNPTTTQSGGLLMALSSAGNTLSFYSPNTAGALTLAATVPLTGGAGTPLVAHFVPLGGSSLEPVEVLSSVGSGSRLDVYSPQGESYGLTSSISSSESLKNFAPVLEGPVTGVAAIGTSVEHFAVSDNGGAFADVQLPFSGKTVTIIAGNGGNGVNGSVAVGGAGGSISEMTILAGQITLQGGTGGSSINAPAGAGGAITDTPTMTTLGGGHISTILQADTSLSIEAGAGGSVTSGISHSADGGAGGAVQGLNISILAGDIVVNSGDGGNGAGGLGGAGGDITAIKAVNNGGDLDMTAGSGGAAQGAFGNGGAGGSISNLTYSLAPTDLTTEMGYNVNIIAGAGGISNSGTGGAGGSVQTAKFSLEPANESYWDANALPALQHENIDSTVRLTVVAGKGGDGAIGGAGGALNSISSTVLYTQVVTITGTNSLPSESFAEVNPVAATLTSGSGGNGSKGTGGAGGSISGLTLTGISHYDLDAADPQAGDIPLVITSGSGGNGATTGGAGGAISGVIAQNAQFFISSTYQNYSVTELAGAAVTSGAGGNGGTGNGGAGGTISNLNIGVSGFDQVGPVTTSQSDEVRGGQLHIISGRGGNGGASAKGGAAGSITGSVVGAADTYENFGILLLGGVGGKGGMGGGAGGNIANIQVSSPENATQNGGASSPDVLSTLIIAGNGGAATAAGGVGGLGGGISQIVESKDVNTPINILQAGNGGAAVTTGGAGGSVIGVNTVGLIGQASDNSSNRFGVFQTNVVQDLPAFEALFPYSGATEVPEGVFAGNGGAGATAGAQGSVMSISAAQIAAIGAAMNSQGLFGAAAKIANITAESIAYDQNGNGLYDNVTGTNKTAPNQAVPIDGFIFSQTVATGINVDPTDAALLSEFTFVS